MSSTKEELFRAESGAVKKPKAGFILLAIALYFLVPAVFAVVSVVSLSSAIATAIPFALLGTMALFYGLRSTRAARFVPAAIAVDSAGSLLCDGAVRASAGSLRQGFVVPSEEGALVRLEQHGHRPSLVLLLRDLGEGHALLQALGLDAHRVAAEMRIASGLLSLSIARQCLVMLTPLAVFLIGVAASMVIWFREPEQAVLAISSLVLALMAYSFTFAFSPTSVRIGTDGVSTRLLGRERYYPFTQIESVHAYEDVVAMKHQHGVRLLLRGGEEVRLVTGQTDIGSDEARRLAARIEEARAAREGGVVAPMNAFFRGSQPIRAWVEELRRIGRGIDDHRRTAVPAEVLGQLVEDTRASAAERIGAAISLVASDERSARMRVRSAAEASAAPRLRIALARIADAASDELDEDVLADLSDLTAEGAKLRPIR